MHRRTLLIAAVTLTTGIMVPFGAGSASASPASSSAKLAVAPAPQAKPATHPTKHLCDNPRPGDASCTAIIRTDYAQPAAAVATDVTTPQGYGPTDLQGAYNLAASGGSGQTIAVVDAYDAPNAEDDLAVYRAQYGLPACTTANGCFRKLNQTGGTTPPADEPAWGDEIDLDIDMVSAACPNCKILLVEADSAGIDDLGTAVNTAVNLGAKFVSNSYAASESPNDPDYDGEYFNHPGVVLTVASGDWGYQTMYPAASPYVTSVGGTTLTKATGTSRGWTETAWSGTGSGCSEYDGKAVWQTDSDSGCANRTVSDVSAVADPQTGVAMYDSVPSASANYQSGWLVAGGTSAATPILASAYALAGTPADTTYPASYLYSHQTTGLNDVTSGSNGTCGSAPLCNARAGYDGPTGLGTPSGSNALTEAGDPIFEYYVSLGGTTDSYLGAPTGPEVPIAGGLEQTYQGGTIYYSAATGAHAVHGVILDKYLSMGGPAGALGFPTSDEQGTADGVARYNTFSSTGANLNDGAIYFTWQKGVAYSIKGKIYAHWISLGGEAGVLGYPITDETGTPDGVGRFNHFSNSGSIYWTPSTGAWSIHGAIRDKWASLGWERSPLGYPTSDELGTADGATRYNTFSSTGANLNDGAIYFAFATGKAFSVRGAIYAHWISLGGEAGVLGYPTIDETGTPDGVGRFNHFSNSGSIYWTPSTGAWSIHGAIRDKWASLGWERSRLGYPTSDEQAVDGGRQNTFQGGTITFRFSDGGLLVAYY